MDICFNLHLNESWTDEDIKQAADASTRWTKAFRKDFSIYDAAELYAPPCFYKAKTRLAGWFNLKSHSTL